MSNNQKVTKTQMTKIRALDDFDLTMLISEINDHGWPVAQKTLAIMPPYADAAKKTEGA